MIFSDSTLVECLALMLVAFTLILIPGLVVTDPSGGILGPAWVNQEDAHSFIWNGAVLIGALAIPGYVRVAKLSGAGTPR